MNLNPFKLNSPQGQSVSFKGKIPTTSDLKTVKKVVDCNLNNLVSEITESIRENSPKLLKNNDGLELPKKEIFIKKVSNSFTSMITMPLDMADSLLAKLYKKLPKSKFLESLNNSHLINNHRKSLRIEQEANALQGLYENGYNFLKDSKINCCDDLSKETCKTVRRKFNKLLNDSMGENKAQYDTKKERFWTRIISGFTAAFFLFGDFYNKGISKGKSKEDANKEAEKKQKQEVIANIGEAVTQFTIFACFSKFINTKLWAAPVIGAGIGLIYHVVSRLATDTPLTKVDVPQKNDYAFKMPTLQEFKDNISSGKDLEFAGKTEPKEDKKTKPFLSAKNILLACLSSIIAGFMLRGAKNKISTTSFGEFFSKQVGKFKDNFHKKTIEEICVDKKKFDKFLETLNMCGERKLGSDILESTLGQFPSSAQNNKILLGTRDKTVKLFGKIEVPLKELYELPLAPLKFIKELVSYPYKMAKKLAEALKIIKKDESIKLITDPYECKNIYLQFKKFNEKYEGSQESFIKPFTNYLHQMRLVSANNKTASKLDNSRSGVIAQVLGMLAGMGFSMNDEFNNSVKVGSTKEEAEKDARLRGINKFFRMTVQVIISGTLNKTFAKQYNNSLVKAGMVTAASTVVTDIASRQLSGMPYSKMHSKQEYDDCKEQHEKGKLAWYYKLIDKLAS